MSLCCHSGGKYFRKVSYNKDKDIPQRCNETKCAAFCKRQKAKELSKKKKNQESEMTGKKKKMKHEATVGNDNYKKRLNSGSDIRRNLSRNHIFIQKAGQAILWDTNQNLKC